MKDNQMSRGKSQSLYKYLPDSWIDFSVRGKYRKNYIAHVIRWNSEQLVDLNKRRLIRLTNQAIKSFASQAQGAGKVEPTSGFGAELDVDSCDVLTPKAGGDERGIVAEISPLTFYCKKCNKVHQFNSVENYKKYTKCRNCGTELTQMRQIYYCKCGWATDKQPAYCRTHGSSNIYWYGGYEFICKSCNNHIPMQKKCEICGTMLRPHVALDPAQYFTYSLSFIDLIDENVEKFISETDYGAYITICYWLGKITFEEFQEIVKDGIVSDPDEYQKKYDFYFNMFKESLGEEPAKVAAKQMADKECGNKYNDMINDLKSSLIASDSEIRHFAEMLIEYSMVNQSNDVSTLEDAKKVATLLNTNANPDEFFDVESRYGFVDAKVCGDVPFVSCSYGYTREKSQYEEGVQLRAFKEEKPGRKNVYATKLRTEGVLFEFDRVKILRWLLKNNYINEDDCPNLESEEEVKIWFVNNIHLGSISTFTPIDEEHEPLTSAVYSLIHSISHLLVKAASEICGLNKDSISEYIFAGIPAVMIYCQNSQGFNLGALFNVFGAYFDKWIKNASKKAEKCVFDPICIERYKACTGCLFLNEVSCQHFNKDLDRRLVIGYVDKIKKTKLYGYWEDV